MNGELTEQPRRALEAALRHDLRDEAQWSVYADWLGSQGDSRGELIGYEQQAAQATDPARARAWRLRAKQLFERDHPRWLGALHRSTMQTTWVRGFVTEAVVHDQPGWTASTLLSMRTGALLYRMTFTRLGDCRSVAEALQHAWVEIVELRSADTTSVEPLAAIEGLRELFVERCTVDDLAALSELPALERLIIQDSRLDLHAFEHGFATLRHLVLVNHGREPPRGTYLDLGPLAQLPALEILELNHSRVRELDPLKRLTTLRQLDISDTHVNSLEPLHAIDSLQRVDASGYSVASSDSDCELLRARDVRVERQPKRARLGPV